MLENELGQWLQRRKVQDEALAAAHGGQQPSLKGYAMTGLRHWSNGPLEAPQFLWRGDLSPLGCEAALITETWMHQTYCASA